MKTMRHIQTWLLITLLALSASNDVWGKRLETNWNGNEVSESQTQGNQRGYTDHEHLDSIGLIHMNGRVYDPKLARFISPDPYIQDPYNTQSFSRYSYVWNNPLRHTDPTGEFIPLIIAGIKIAGLAYGVYEAAEVARGIATGEITGQEAVTGAVITAGLNLVGGAAFKTVNKVTPPVVKEQIKDVVDKALRKNTDAQQNLSDSGTPLKKEQGGGDNNTVVASDVNDDATKGVVANGRRGRASEARVLDDLGLPKNNTKVSTAEGNSIPDALTSTKSIEIKDCISVSCTGQIRIQTQAARNSGRESILVTGKNTNVNQNTRDAFDRIIRRDDLGPQ